MTDYLGGEEAFRMVLDQLLDARKDLGAAQSDLKMAQGHISVLDAEHGLKLTAASDHIAREKSKLVELGSKLYAAAYKVKDFDAPGAVINGDAFLELRNVLHECANTFDEIPF